MQQGAIALTAPIAPRAEPKCVVLPIEPEQRRALQPLLSHAWHGNRAIIGDILPTPEGHFFRFVTISRKTWEKVRAILDKELTPRGTVYARTQSPPKTHK